MSRCKACNREMSGTEMCATQLDGSPEDMCIVCRYKAREEAYEMSGYYLDDIEDFDIVTQFFKDNDLSLRD